MVIQVTEKDKRIEQLESRVAELEASNHEQLLKINGLELENGTLKNQIVKLETEISDFSFQVRSKRETSVREMSTIIDEHKTEKEEWEKLREGILKSPILQNARTRAQTSNERDRTRRIQEAIFARV